MSQAVPGAAPAAEPAPVAVEPAAPARPARWWTRTRVRVAALLAVPIVLAGATFGLPTLAAAFTWQGDAALAAGQLGDAERAYRRADWLDPAAPVAALRLGELELRRNRPRSADLWFARAAQRPSAATEAAVGRARAHLQLGELAQVESLLWPALAEQVEPAVEAEARQVLARLRLAQRDAPAAVAAWRAAVGLGAAQPVPPGWLSEARLRLGLLLAAAGDLAGAEAALDAAARGRDPAWSEPARAALADVTLAARQGDPIERDVLVGDLLVRHDLGWLALERLERAVAARPGTAEAALRLAAAYMQVGRSDDAAGPAARAAELAPNEPAARILLGIVRRAQGDWSASAEALRRAAALAPDDPVPWRELAQTNRAAGAWPAVEAALLEAAARDPDPFAGQLAVVEFQLDRLYHLERAVERARALAEQRPDRADAADLYGWALHLTGQTEPAVETLRRAVRLAPLSAAARYHLGLALRGRGDRAGAERELRAAADLDTTGRYLRPALTALGEVSG